MFMYIEFFCLLPGYVLTWLILLKSSEMRNSWRAGKHTETKSSGQTTILPFWGSVSKYWTLNPQKPDMQAFFFWIKMFEQPQKEAGIQSCHSPQPLHCPGRWRYVCCHGGMTCRSMELKEEGADRCDEQGNHCTSVMSWKVVKDVLT